MQFIALTFFHTTLYFTIFLGVSTFLYIYVKSYKTQIQKYPLLFQNNTSVTQILLLGVTIIILSLNLLGPSISIGKQESIVQGNDVLIILDVSKSMNAYDLKGNNTLYSRIEFAKATITDMVLQNTQNRYGLVIFAGEAVAVSPLTHDSQVFLNFLKNVDYRNVNSQGTNLEAAYTLGVQRFGNDHKETLGNMILLFSDGGDEDDITNFSKLKEILNESDIEHTVIGIGTEVGSKIIDGKNIFGEVQYQQFKGKDVITKRNTSTLKNIAKLRNGNYYEITNTNNTIDFQNIFSDLEKKTIKKGIAEHYISMGRVLTIVAFLLFSAMLFIVILPKRRKK